jgi:hypothetical protein
MKNHTLTLLLLLSLTTLFAQAPQKMSYQSVIRKTDGTLVVNTLVGMKISILQEAANGPAVYVETQTPTTNANGLTTLAIGGGTAVTGTFAGINWASGTYFIKTETDPVGGTNYTISGTSQLLSVPYALYAGSSQSKGKPSIMISGNITDAQAAAKIAAEAGPSTENILIFDTTGLTTLDLSMVKSCYSLEIVGNVNLTTINLSGLTEVFEYGYISSNNALGTLSFPALTAVYARSGFTIQENPALTSLSFPVLSKIVRMSIRGDVSTLSFPMLTTASGLSVESTVLTSVNFPTLTTIGGLLISSPKLASIGLPLLNYSESLGLGGALPSSQINAVLSKMLSVTPATGKIIYLKGQTPPAPPTGQGIIDKTTLINAGNEVSTD